MMKFLAALLASLALHSAVAEDVIHQGPSLEVRVQRGEQRLPLSRVDRLHAGDTVLVRAATETLAKGDWVLLLARVAPRGNQVESRHFDVADLRGEAGIEITADGQVPVVMIAPQLRNLFGLTTSLYESARILNEVLRADPQRFFDLQRADQINQAIRTISDGLARRVSGRNPEEAIQATRALASRFGVQSVDPACFRNQTVNTECVATSIVANRDFALPSANDLSAMVGPRKAADLNSFLAANLRVLTDAADYLGNRYRDTYDFAPTFGRRQSGGARVDLFSVTRFRSGGVKTAYIYVPAWFSGTPPSLSPERARTGCYAAGRLDIRVDGRLPLANYWHDWRMTVSDAGTRAVLATIDAPDFDPESGSFRFTPAAFAGSESPSGNQVVVELAGRFGFDAVKIEPIRMALPLRDARAASDALEGLSALVSGEHTAVRFTGHDRDACVREIALTVPGGTTLRSETDAPGRLQANLRAVPPGAAELRIEQIGATPIVLSTRVRPPRASVTRAERADFEDTVTVHGDRLERIARIEAGRLVCHAVAQPAGGSGAMQSMRLLCEGGSLENAQLPDRVTVFHREGEPGPIQAPLVKTPARPRIDIATDTPNALLVNPSAKALKWNLTPEDRLMTEDSGLALLLRARAPYVLSRGSYQLQLRFLNDPRPEATPISAPTIADAVHQELRTRTPIRFRAAELPSVVNPLEFRVVHQPSGLAGDWTPLGRSVLMLPELAPATCAPTGDALWVPGTHLELIESVQLSAVATSPQGGFTPAVLVPCPSGLCLRLPPRLPHDTVGLRIRWVDDRAFDVRIAHADHACPAEASAPTLPVPAAGPRSER